MWDYHYEYEVEKALADGSLDAEGAKKGREEMSKNKDKYTSEVKDNWKKGQEELKKNEDAWKTALGKCQKFAKDITAEKVLGENPTKEQKEAAEKSLKRLKWSVDNAEGSCCCCIVTIIVIIGAVVAGLVLVGVAIAVVLSMMGGSKESEEEGVFESSADETLAYAQ